MEATVRQLIRRLVERRIFTTEEANEMLTPLDLPWFCVHPDCALPGAPALVPPSYETTDSVGCDLAAYLWEPLTIDPGDAKVIRTGWSVDMPPGTECQIRSRSGLAAKFGVSVLNSPGTIESDYHPNDIKVILHNGGPAPFVVNHGDRIAQAVFNHITRASNAEYKNQTRTGGLGHTGR